MDVTRAFGRAMDLDTLQNFALQSPAKAFDGLEATLFGSRLKLLDRTDAELPMQL
jgi:hypothetical protein